MSSTSDQQPQPPQRPTPLTDAEVAELINEAMKAQSVLNQVCGGVGRLGKTVGNTAYITYQMFSNAYAQKVYGPIFPIDAEKRVGGDVFINEAFDVGGRLDREQPLGSS